MSKAVSDALEVLEDLAASQDHAELVREAADARMALEGRHFHVAFVGQFKRGKSALVHAILGREVLAADIVPVTNILTARSTGGRRGPSSGSGMARHGKSHSWVSPRSPPRRGIPGTRSRSKRSSSASPYPFSIAA
jgi:hypothetical protein